MEVFASLVGNEDEDSVAFDTALGIVVGSNILAGNGAAVLIKSRDSGAPVGFTDNADEEREVGIVGENVVLMLGNVPRLLQEGDCG